MAVINLTPHNINYYDGDDLIYTIPPSGKVARISTTQKVVGYIKLADGIKMPDVQLIWGAATDLPPQRDDTTLIVSFILKQAFPNRTDLRSPNDLVRNDQGVPIGARSLSV